MILFWGDSPFNPFQSRLLVLDYSSGIVEGENLEVKILEEHSSRVFISIRREEQVLERVPKVMFKASLIDFKIAKLVKILRRQPLIHTL